MKVYINRLIITLRGANSRLKWRKNVIRISFPVRIRACVSLCPLLHKTEVRNCCQRWFMNTGKWWRHLKTYTQSLRFSPIPISGASPQAAAWWKDPFPHIQDQSSQKWGAVRKLSVFIKKKGDNDNNREDQDDGQGELELNAGGQFTLNFCVPQGIKSSPSSSESSLG